MGEGYFHSISGINWQQAKDYCSALQIDGLPGWRLPTIDEAKAMLVPAHVNERDVPRSATSPEEYYGAYNSMFFKGGISAPGRVWTSTPVDTKTAWTVEPGGYFTTVNKTKTDGHINKSAVCVRTMEPDTLEIAQQAHVTHPVTDVQTLRAYVPLNQAALAYNNAQYQESVTQAQAALAIEDRLRSRSFRHRNELRHSETVGASHCCLPIRPKARQPRLPHAPPKDDKALIDMINRAQSESTPLHLDPENLPDIDDIQFAHVSRLVVPKKGKWIRYRPAMGASVPMSNE